MQLPPQSGCQTFSGLPEFPSVPLLQSLLPVQAPFHHGAAFPVTSFALSRLSCKWNSYQPVVFLSQALFTVLFVGSSVLLCVSVATYFIVCFCPSPRSLRAPCPCLHAAPLHLPWPFQASGLSLLAPFLSFFLPGSWFLIPACWFGRLYR